MHIERDGRTAHLWTASPATSGAIYIGSVPIAPSETPDSNELLYRLGVRATPFDYDFAVMAGALGTYLVSRKIPNGARILGGKYKVDTTFISAGADAGEVAIGSEAAGDLMTAAAISTGTALDAATPVELLLAAKDTVKLTADRQIRIDVTVQVLTAGKMSGHVFWTMEDARAKSFTAA